MEKAIFAGGCFWCLDTVFRKLEGVVEVVSGYTGGHSDTPDYHSVCEGLTGHAEAVAIDFDPDTIRYIDLLEIFFAIHDPTTLNRQGHDVGTQYRSAIFFTNETQQQLAQRYIEQLNAKQIFSAPVVTELTAASAFFPAEADHQNYFENNSNMPYCHIVIAPKLRKFKEIFQDKLKK